MRFQNNWPNISAFLSFLRWLVSDKLQKCYNVSVITVKHQNPDPKTSENWGKRRNFFSNKSQETSIRCDILEAVAKYCYWLPPPISFPPQG